MNLDAFRKVIREEVKKAIQEEMREVLLEAVKSASAPKSFENNSPTLIHTENQIKPKFSEIIAEQKQYKPQPLVSTGNPILDILNETAQAGEWRTLNGGEFNASQAVGWAGGAPGMMGGGSNTPVVASVDEMIKSQGPVRDINDVSIDVVPDFSKFMGALKEKGSI